MRNLRSLRRGRFFLGAVVLLLSSAAAERDVIYRPPPPKPEHPVWRFSTPQVVPGSRKAPEYPDVALRLGLGARVILRVLVDEQGEVREVVPVATKPVDPLNCEEVTVRGNSLRATLPRKVAEELESAAAMAVTRWTYRPAWRNQEPVSAYISVVIDFCDESRERVIR